MESPFSSRLNTNYVPLDEEFGPIRDLVEDRRRQLEKLQTEISRLTEELKVLEDEEEVHNTFINRHLALISPVRRLPTDILQSIFTELIVQEDEVMPPLGWDLYDYIIAPISLSHVCRDWRQAAIDFAPLWSDVRISLPTYPNLNYDSYGYYTPPMPPIGADDEEDEEETAIHRENVVRWQAKIQRLREIAATWLSRARGSEIRVMIHSSWLNMPKSNMNRRYTEEEEREALELLEQLLEDICKVSNQWKKIHIKVDPSFPRPLLSKLLDIPSEKVPVLRDIKLDLQPSPVVIHLTGDASGNPAPLIPVKDGILSGPAVKIVHFGRLPSEDVLYIPVKWSSLTELVFQGYSLEPHSYSQRVTPKFSVVEALFLLRHCPLLVKCELWIGAHTARGSMPVTHYSSVPSLSNYDPVYLPMLEDFTVHEGFPLNTFFDIIFLPCLKSLSFTTAASPSDQNSSSLRTLVRKCSDTITSLWFDYDDLHEDDIEYCLSNLPNLVHLSFNKVVKGLLDYPHYPTRYNGGTKFSTRLLGLLTPGRANSDEDSDDHLGLPCLCPKLESFSCVLQGRKEFTEVDVISFIESRRPKKGEDGGLVADVTPLKKIDIRFRRKLRLDFGEELGARNVDIEGMEIQAVGPSDQYIPSIPAPIPPGWR